MAKGASYIVQYRRKREGRTNYKTRLDMLKSRKSRLVVRKTNTKILIQLIDYSEDGDKVGITTGSNELKDFGWKYSCNNIPAAYLTGYLCAKKALAAGKKEAVLDIGLQPSVKGTRLYSALKGAVDAGMEIPKGDKAFPDEKHINGSHIAEYASKMGKADYEKKFSGYIKSGADPKNIATSFQEVKSSIDKSPTKSSKK